MLRLVLSALAFTMMVAGAVAQDARPQVSQCQLIAEKLPDVTFASFKSPAGTPGKVLSGLQRVQFQEDVTITYLGHSTFQVDTPGGISIATDFNGWLRSPRLPDVVTMNKAHSSHYTLAGSRHCQCPARLERYCPRRESRAQACGR